MGKKGNSDDTPVVEEFGSFLMDIFSAKSDLDLSVNFNDKEVDFPRDKKIKSLRKFGKKLYALQRKGHVSSVQKILSAKVPILKVVDRGSGIECDISVENRDGILKSQIVHMISSIDERFQMLSFLMKTWAKAHDINSSKDRTLNSLSIILLVAFHLQTRDPPILPPFAEILKDGTDPAAVGKIVREFLDYGKMNKESLGELFITLLIKLASVETLWPKGLCASVYEGCWIFKEWALPPKRKLDDSKFGCISVEDFTDRSQNVARAVGKKEVTKIYKFIHHSILYVLSFMNGQIQGTRLRPALFGRESMPAPTTNFDSNISNDPVMMKRMRLTEQAIPSNPILIKTVYWGGPPTEGWDGKPVESWGASIQPDQIQPKMMQYAVGWGGIRPATNSDPFGTKGTQFAEGWGGNSVSCASAEILSVPAQNPTLLPPPPNPQGYGWPSWNDTVPTPHVPPPPNPQGSGWPSWNDMVPMPHVGTVYAQHARTSRHQNTGHGPHSNGYGNW